MAEDVMETALTLILRRVYRFSYRTKILAMEIADWMHISRACVWPGPTGGWGWR